MSKGKIVGIIALVLVLTLCLGVIFWYAYIAVFGKEKFVTNTFYVGELENASGETRNIIEVQYNQNADGQGLELFEVKINGFTDGSQTDFYSQGVQYVADSPTDKIKWFTIQDYFQVLKGSFSDFGISGVDEFESLIGNMNSVSDRFWQTGALFWYKEWIARYMSPTIFEGASRYNYQQFSNDDTTGSSNPLTEDSYIIANFGGEEDPVYIQFKGADYVSASDFSGPEDFEGDKNAVVNAGRNNFYNNYNVDYLAYILYEQIQALPAGTNGTYVFEFADIFNYYGSEDDMTSGVQLNQEDSLKVKQNMRSYYSIKVTVSANGAKNAQDSMFGVLHGSSTYSLDGSGSSSGDYFAGRQLINVDIYDFDYVKVIDNKFALKLKQEFKDIYLSKSNSIILSIFIDETALSELGMTFVGFTADSGLSDFMVLSVESSSGPIELEVA